MKSLLLNIIIFFLIYNNIWAEDLITYKSDSLTILGYGQLLSWDYSNKTETLFTLGKSGYVYKWDINTGNSDIIYGDYRVRYNKLAVSDDGHRAIISDDGNKIIVFNIENGQNLVNIKSSRECQALDINKDGNKISYSIADMVNIFHLNEEVKYYFPFDPDWTVETIKFAYLNDILIASMTSVNQTKIVVLGYAEGNWSILSEYLYPGKVNIKISKDDAYFGVSYLNKIDIISLKEYKVEKTIEADLKEISDFDFIENGTKIIYSAMWDSSVFIADYVLDEHFRTAVKGANLKLINTSSDDAIFIEKGNNIRLSNIYDGTLLRTFIGHTSAIRTLSFMNEDSKILTDFGGLMAIIDYKKGVIDHTFETSPLMVGQSKDGKYIVSSGNKCLNIYDGYDYHLKKVLCGHSDLIESFAFSPDGKYLASASDEIFIWDLNTFEQMLSIYSGMGFISSVIYDPGSNNIYGSSYRMIRAWDSKTGELYAEPEAMITGDYIQTLAFSEDGMVLTASARTGDLLFLDDRTLEIIGSFPTPTGSPLLDISFDKTSLYAIVSDWSGNLAIFSRLDVGFIRTINTYKNDKIWRARISQDNKSLICTHDAGLIYIFNFERYLSSNESYIENESGSTFYPNPVKDEIYFTFPTEVSSGPKFELFDKLGCRIAELEIFNMQSDKRIYINLSEYNLPNGVYFIKVSNGEEIITGKIIVNR